MDMSYEEAMKIIKQTLNKLAHDTSICITCIDLRWNTTMMSQPPEITSMAAHASIERKS